MLGFMSLGYYLGGRLADARLDVGNLFWILVGAAFSVALVSFSEAALLPSLAKQGATSARLFAVISATVLFAVPSTLLGMVSPYCIRLRMHAIEDSGATVGTLYAISTLGSIVGTFAAGFWLISVFGTHDFLIALSLGLAALSLLAVLAESSYGSVPPHWLASSRCWPCPMPALRPVLRASTRSTTGTSCVMSWIPRPVNP